MKSSHKLYAAAGGLMIAALMGYGGAFASDTPTVDAANVQPIEVTSEAPATTGSDSFNLQGISSDEATVAAQADGENEAKPAEDPAAEQTPAEEVIPEQSAPGVENSAENPTIAEAATEPTPAADSETAAAEPSETAAESAAPAEAEKAPAEAGAVEGSTAAEAEAANVAPVATAAPSEVKTAPVIPVTYVAPRHSSVVPDFDADVIVPDPQAEAPLLTMAKTETQAPSADANGESMVVWFELPEPAGPALVPGQATPLLNAAVSEEAASINANVVPVTAVQQGAAVQSNPQQKVAPARAANVNESGTLSRGLARTGSIAQYATLLSAGALILGVALLAGAIATSRRNSRLVDAE